MLSPDYYLRCMDALVPLLARFDEAVISDIARRLIKTGGMTATAKLQIRQAQEMGLLYEDVLASVARMSGAMDSAVRAIFEDAGVRAVQFDNAIYEAAGLSPTPLRASPRMLQMLQAGYDNTTGTLRNLTLTTADTAQAAYIQACDLAALQIQSGAFGYADAIARAVRSVAADGTWVSYPTGHRDRLDVAVRRAVLTGVGKTCRTICAHNAATIGCDLMEISAHAGARPSHAVWQGKIVSLSGQKGYLSLDDIGYGSGDGFGGWNCRHDWYPYFAGISERAYSSQDLDKLEHQTVTVDGQEMTYYDATQIQRKMEREIRETKRELVALDAARGDIRDDAARAQLDETFANQSVKLRQQRNALESLTSQVGLLQDGVRTQFIAFDRSVSQKSVWAQKKLTRPKRYDTIDIDKEAVYEAAASGAKHRGIFVDARNKSDAQLRKSFLSHVAQVDEHWTKLQNPEMYDTGWNEKTEIQKTGLLRKWEKDMYRNAEQAAIEERILRERGVIDA